MKMLSSFRGKRNVRIVVGRVEEGPLCDPKSKLLLGGSLKVVRT